MGQIVNNFYFFLNENQEICFVFTENPNNFIVFQNNPTPLDIKCSLNIVFILESVYLTFNQESRTNNYS